MPIIVSSTRVSSLACVFRVRLCVWFDIAMHVVVVNAWQSHIATTCTHDQNHMLLCVLCSDIFVSYRDRIARIRRYSCGSLNELDCVFESDATENLKRKEHKQISEGEKHATEEEEEKIRIRAAANRTHEHATAYTCSTAKSICHTNERTIMRTFAGRSAER